MAGATKDCVFVHGALNQEAYEFNRGATTIAGTPRQEWLVDTLQLLVHEAQHAKYQASPLPDQPSGVTTASCTRANPDVETELDEVGAFISEFPVAFRAYPFGPPPHLHTDTPPELVSWFQYAVPYIRGSLEMVGCYCDCGEVDAFVVQTFESVSQSWTAEEEAAFHYEISKPRWGIAWPISLSPLSPIAPSPVLPGPVSPGPGGP
jgi:hypothetical protein